MPYFHFFLIPAVVSQNVSDESCLAFVKSEKYVVWITLRPLRSRSPKNCEDHDLFSKLCQILEF